MAVIHMLKIRSWVQTKTSPTPSQQCTVFVLSSWEQLFVKEPDYRYPIRPYVIECIFLALRQWTREGYITSQQDVWLQEQSVHSVSLRAGSSLGMHTNVKMSYTKDKSASDQHLIHRDPRSSCLSVAQNATRNKECLLGSVGIRYSACAWGLILIFYSPKKVCSSLTTGTR